MPTYVNKSKKLDKVILIIFLSMPLLYPNIRIKTIYQKGAYNFSPHALLLCMAEGRGGGMESAMQRVQIPRRRGRETTYTACLLPSGNCWRVRLSRLATIWSFYLHLAGVSKIQIACGRDSRRRRDANRQYHRFYRCDGGHHL